MNIYMVLSTLVWLSIPLVLMAAPFVVIYFSIKRTAKKARLENMSKVDFERDVDYYRDILEGHSIAALSYIDDFQINVRREISATLLNLRLKKKIEIAENEICVLDSNLLGLKRSEKINLIFCSL